MFFFSFFFFLRRPGTGEFVSRLKNGKAPPPPSRRARGPHDLPQGGEGTGKSEGPSLLAADSADRKSRSESLSGALRSPPVAVYARALLRIPDGVLGVLRRNSRSGKPAPDIAFIPKKKKKKGGVSIHILTRLCLRRPAWYCPPKLPNLSTSNATDYSYSLEVLLFCPHLPLSM